MGIASAIYLEEYAQALEETGGDHEFAQFADNHRFNIPEDCLWDDLRERTENVGQALVTMLRQIEEANPDTLYGIFGQTSLWTNKQKLPDARLRDLVEQGDAFDAHTGDFGASGDTDVSGSGDENETFKSGQQLRVVVGGRKFLGLIFEDGPIPPARRQMRSNPLKILSGQRQSQPHPSGERDDIQKTVHAIPNS